MGAELRMFVQFELLGTPVAQSGVKTLSIVKHFDVFEDAPFGRLEGLVSFPVHELLLQTGKKAVHRRVAPIVAFGSCSRYRALLGAVDRGQWRTDFRDLSTPITIPG